MIEDPSEAATRDVRETRLSRTLSGTNLERAGDYNMRTVLRAIRLQPDVTRIEIAQQTGLTAPTIANITHRLSERGLVAVSGRRKGVRGHPALKLRVAADGAFGIGLNIDRDHLTLVILDLEGRVRSRVSREIAFALPGDVLAFVQQELDGALAQGGVVRERVIGVGVALPDDLGRISLPNRPEGYACWSETEIDAMLADLLPWPIHCDNDAAAAALGEAEYGVALDSPSFFYLLVSAGLGGGPVIDRIYHRGANLRSGEIGLMPDATAAAPGVVVQDTVSVSALLKRLEDAGFERPGLADLEQLDAHARPVVDAWLADSTRVLTPPLVALSCLIDPDAVLIGGRLPQPLIERLAARLTQALDAVSMPSRPRVMPAIMSRDAPAIGAAILPFLDQLLPSDAILMQAGRE